MGEGGAKTKFKDNVAALRLLKTLQSESRHATAEEQRVLVRYVGWGGIPQAFDHRNTEWSKEYAELAELLPKEEYEAARRSTQDAHYTAKPVVDAIYHGLDRLGFEGGRILEPSVGSGNFVGLMPAKFRDGAKVTGVELDPVTAAIAKQLYPKATIINKGFQEVTIPSDYFDAVVGNPPFGNQQLYDPNHKELSEFSIHNFFIAKSLDKVREGGVTAVVVSNFFLDAANSAAREHVADRARLLGAVRLPNTAFKQNALTEVTTDIVFLQKLREGETADRSWVNTGAVRDEASGEEIPLNQYFIDHPDMMLGQMTLAGTMYRGGQAALIATPGQDLTSALSQAIEKLPQGVYRSANEPQQVEAADKPVIVIPDNTKVGAYFVAGNGRIARRLPDVLDQSDYEWVEVKNEKAAERIKGMIGVRAALRELMAAEQSEFSTDAELARRRSDLNMVYDRFVKKHGHISALPNRQAMSEDPEYPLLHALERDYDKGISKETAKKHGVEPREPSAAKATIFSKRVMSPHREITRVETAKDALVVSMNEVGRVDTDLMVRLTGKAEDELVNELRGLIYRNPATRGWETADHYLTGNVKDKLKLARAAASVDDRYVANVDALALVQPADIEPVDIAIQLGSTWVPGKVVDDFVTHLVGGVHRNISYQPSLGKWLAKIGRGDKTTMTVQWGTEDAPANELLECILTNRAVQVKDLVGREQNGAPIYQVNEEKTAAAGQKADEIRQAFLDWVWQDKDRRESLARIYNDRFNTNVAPKYDGSHLTLPGASLGITLRPHQKDAIWRSVQDGTALFDHVVGAGKTIVCIGAAMESKRMGLLKKPMFVVPNHLLLQWKDSFYSLYPNANILVAEKSDFTKENRQRLFAKIATGDWDAVIVAHSSFKKIGMPAETLREILNEQIDDLSMALVRLKEEKGDRVTIKEMEKARDRMKTKLEKTAETGSKDTAVSFADLGVDGLFVDEAHEFKNLFITTSLSRVSGLGNLAGSDKAFDLFVKARHLQKQHNGRGIFFATGTPISNTIAELYTVQRYMQYDELKSKGIVHFDAWASTFGQVVTGWELDATGVNYKLNSRFAKFQNVPELVSMYRTFADVITKADLDRQAEEQGKRFPVPKMKGGKPRNVIVERSPLQSEFMGIQTTQRDSEGLPIVRPDGSYIKGWNEGSIIHRMENLPKDPRLDNPLKITNDARKAGLDFRLIDPASPDFEGSKVNEAANEIYRIWKEWEDKKGTQLVFCDLSTPKGGRSHSAPVVREAGDDDEPDEPTAISMDELLAGSGGAFSVYDDLKSKLIARGVPAHEIRFIHEANTDLQKSKLFDQINRGEVRLLFGSTAKMGAGTNAQRKLVALHHLDAPWRPSDLEQREGRILRQGNEFYEADPDGFEVEVVRYATKQTYDSRMWQTIEYKAAGIEQFRKGDSLQRVIEDIAGEAANAAEMKAAATGNPLIFMQVQLSADLKKLEAVYANFRRNRHSLESRVEWLERANERADTSSDTARKEIARRDTNTTDPWQFHADGHKFDNDGKEQLLGVVMGAMKHAIDHQATAIFDKPEPVPVGKYRGFEIEVFARRGTVQFVVKGHHTYQPDNLIYDKEDKFSLGGFLQRLDNFMSQFEVRLESAERGRRNELAELEKAKLELAKGFPQQQKLELLRKDVGDVMVELKKMQNDSNYVSAWQPASLGGEQSSLPLQQPAAPAPAVEERSNFGPGTVKRADMVVADYLAAAANPLHADEVFDGRNHDRLFEMGDGNEVHQIVLERIADNRELAMAIATAPGKRYASQEMLDKAEEVTGLRARAAEAAQGLGLEPSPANRDSGIYGGKVVALTEHYLVQDVGMRSAILHHRDDLLLGQHLKVGDPVHLTYRCGSAIVRDRPKAQEQSIGR